MSLFYLWLKFLSHKKSDKFALSVEKLGVMYYYHHMDNQYSSWAKIVIVEDEESLADIYKTRLELLGYICFVAKDGLEALALIEQERPSLVLLDLMLPKLAGDQILRVMRESEWGKDIKVFVISNLNENDAPSNVRSLKIEGYAVKANLANDQLDGIVDNILRPSGAIQLNPPEPPQSQQSQNQQS